MDIYYFYKKKKEETSLSSMGACPTFAIVFPIGLVFPPLQFRNCIVNSEGQASKHAPETRLHSVRLEGGTSGSEDRSVTKQSRTTVPMVLLQPGPVSQGSGSEPRRAWEMRRKSGVMLAQEEDMRGCGTVKRWQQSR